MTSDLNEDIFSRFRASVEDFGLAALEEVLSNEVLTGYFKQVISQPLVRRLFSDFEFDSDVGEVEYTMRTPWNEDADKDFVEEVLSMGMAYRWSSQKYKSTRNTAQIYTNKEQSFFSQKNHMDGLKDMMTTSKYEFHKLIRDRGYSLEVVNSE